MEDIVLKISLIGLLGVSAQWLAWRFQFPAIVLLSLAGLAVGPGLGIINPVDDFGDLFGPMISIAVAIILFEGGLTLNFHEIKNSSHALRRLIIIAGPISWGLGTLAGYYIGGMSWGISILVAGLLVVTGPTVVTPLLRQAKLLPRPASLLRWEAIVNDPIGAMYAAFAFAALTALHHDQLSVMLVLHLLLGVGAALVIGFISGSFLIYLFIKGLMAEYLKAPFILSLVIATFSISNHIFEETGLIAVTVLGITLANSRIASLEQMRRFKEYMTILLVSGVFIILTATLDFAIFAKLGWNTIIFIFILLILIRPFSIFLSLIGAKIPLKETLFVGLMAPRGIVAVAISGAFAQKLIELGVAGAEILVPLVFAVVFITVILCGFSIRPLAQALDLSSKDQLGVVIVGVNSWTTELAMQLRAMGIPILMADSNWYHLRQARLNDLPYYYGEILSEASEHTLDLNRFDYLISATENPAYNALVCTEFGNEFGRSHVFELGSSDEDDPHALSFTLGGRDLLHGKRDFEAMQTGITEGLTFSKTQITEAYSFETYLSDIGEDVDIIFIKKSNGRLIFNLPNSNIKADNGDIVLSFGSRD